MASTGQRWCTGIDLAFGPGREEGVKVPQGKVEGSQEQKLLGVPFLAVMSLQ